MPTDSTSYLDFNKPDGFNKYAAGPKTYGLGGGTAPQAGPMGTQSMTGYMERDAEARARRNAILARMKLQQADGMALPVGTQPIRGAV